MLGSWQRFSPGLTPASTGSGWCVNAMRGDLVWEVRALKSNFPGFLSEPGEDSPGKKKNGINKKSGWGKREENREVVLINKIVASFIAPLKKYISLYIYLYIN